MREALASSCNLYEDQTRQKLALCHSFGADLQMKEIGEIELSIQGGTEEIEALGEAGKVEESMEKLAAVEALKGLKGEKEKELQNLNETAGASGHQKLRVCETCVSDPGVR